MNQCNISAPLLSLISAFCLLCVSKVLLWDQKRKRHRALKNTIWRPFSVSWWDPVLCLFLSRHSSRTGPKHRMFKGFFKAWSNYNPTKDGRTQPSSDDHRGIEGRTFEIISLRTPESLCVVECKTMIPPLLGSIKCGAPPPSSPSNPF